MQALLGHIFPLCCISLVVLESEATVECINSEENPVDEPPSRKQMIPTDLDTCK